MRNDADAGRARFHLTFDFELGWGAIESQRWRRRQADGVYRRLRDVLPGFLRELDQLELPATWATVGAMLEPPGRHDLDHLPGALRDLTRGALAEAEPSTFDGRDLYAQVVGARVGHQIASHTYAHPRFSHPDMTAAIVRADLERFRAAVPSPARIDRLVFPQNAEAFHATVGAAGYGVVRGADTPGDGPAAKLGALLSPPPFAELQPGDGVTRLVGSMFFNPGYRRLHRLPVLYALARRGLARAVRARRTLHLWLHPFNLAEVAGLAWTLTRLLRTVAHERDRGRIATEVF